MPTQFESPLEIDIGTNDLDNNIDVAINAGFKLRAIVVEKKLTIYQKTEPVNWGVITQIDRFNDKPLLCLFFTRASSKPEHFLPSELQIVYPAKSYNDLIKELEL